MAKRAVKVDAKVTNQVFHSKIALSQGTKLFRGMMAAEA
jgi:hypothetical protein